MAQPGNENRKRAAVGQIREQTITLKAKTGRTGEQKTAKIIV